MGLAAGIVAVGASVAGSAISASAQKKAANKAASTELAVAEKNNALAREFRADNEANLSPFMDRGNAAGGAINALLGLGGTSSTTSTTPTSAPTPTPTTATNIPTYNEWLKRLPSFIADGAGGKLHDAYLARYGSTSATTAPATSVPTTTATQGVSAQQAAANAFDIFRNSTGYQFRLGEGMNALNSGYAGAGTIQSGDAMRAAAEYGQNFASNEFGNYMGYLGNQQGIGLQGASALAGVSTNALNAMTANNNNAADAAANAALVKGQNNPWANALGTLGGTILSGGFG